MKKLLFIQYPSCSTCKKAEKWLKENNIEFESRHIVEENPTADELSSWTKLSKLPVNKIFNTAGKVYKEQNIKEKVKSESTYELIRLLSTNGMLVKRPIIVTDSNVLVGFNEEDWKKALL